LGTQFLGHDSCVTIDQASFWFNFQPIECNETRNIFRVEMGRSNLGFRIEDMEHFEVSQSVPKGFDGFSLIENTLKTSRIMNE
jgi:hypothetical protein